MYLSVHGYGLQQTCSKGHRSGNRMLELQTAPPDGLAQLPNVTATLMSGMWKGQGRHRGGDGMLVLDAAPPRSPAPLPPPLPPGPPPPPSPAPSVLPFPPVRMHGPSPVRHPGC